MTAIEGPSAGPVPCTIRGARADDAGTILEIQRLAYRREAALYDDWSIPPLHETVEQVKAVIAASTVLVAEADGVVVGSVRGELREGSCLVGRLSVLPDAQGRGIGTRLTLELERRMAAAGATRFELFTGDRSAANLRLYGRLGYREFRRAPLTPVVTLVFMEKPAG